MIPGFGAHYRMYRLAVALDRLRDMPPTTKITPGWAARVLGTTEVAVRGLISRYVPSAAANADSFTVATLRHAVQMAWEARRKG